MRTLKKKAVIISAFAFLVSVAAGVFFVVSLCAARLDFSAAFYYVCYRSPADSASASSVSDLVQSYGGAGYIINVSDEYFVALACYYSEKDADSVSAKLNKRGVDCFVKEVTAKNFKAKGGAKKYVEKYESNLETLLSISRLLYSLANSLDNFTAAQEEAKSVLSDIKSSLCGLLSANTANCFTAGVKYILAEYGLLTEGYILSGSVRRLQIAVTDMIANINIY